MAVKHAACRARAPNLTPQVRERILRAMFKNNLVWLVGSLCAMSLASLQGCDNDDDDDGSGGTTSGGSAGKGGSGGTAGKGGSTTGGTAGKGGSSSGGTTGDAGGTGTGTAGDTSGGGDTGAAGDTGTAGAGGGGAESVCDMYCAEFATVCQVEAAMADDYASDEACMTACAGFPEGTNAEYTGDTAWCRLNHVRNADGATGQDLTDHCGHAQETPTGQCE